MKIETPEFNLRLIDEKDCTLITHYFQDKDVIEPLERPPIPFKYDDALGFVKRMKETYLTNRPELFIIADKETDDIMGCVGMHPEHTFDNRKDVAEMGYWLGKPFWRKGITYLAVKEIIKYAFNEMKYIEIVAQTNTDNIASMSLLKKLGFDFLENRKRDVAPSRGTDEDSYFVLSKDNYIKIYGNSK